MREREIPLSISRETSFHRDTADRAEIEGMLEYLAGRACRTARELGIKPGAVSCRLRYSDGEWAERTRALATPSDADPVVLASALDSLQRQFTRRVALHGVGLTLTRFARGGGEQGALFDEPEAGRRAALYRAFDGVRDRYGHGVLVSGRALHLKGRLGEDDHGFLSFPALDELPPLALEEDDALPLAHDTVVCHSPSPAQTIDERSGAIGLKPRARS